MGYRTTKRQLASQAKKLTSRLEELEKPEIREMLVRRLTPLIAKAPVLVLHQICQQLEMMQDDK